MYELGQSLIGNLVLILKTVVFFPFPSFCFWMGMEGGGGLFFKKKVTLDIAVWCYFKKKHVSSEANMIIFKIKDFKGLLS